MSPLGPLLVFLMFIQFIYNVQYVAKKQKNGCREISLQLRHFCDPKFQIFLYSCIIESQFLFNIKLHKSFKLRAMPHQISICLFPKILIAIQQALCSRPRKIESTHHFHSKSECDLFFRKRRDYFKGTRKDWEDLKTCATDYIYC